MERKISSYKDEKIYYNHIVIDNPLQKNFELHTHDICELIFLKQGNVTAVIGDKSYKFKKHNLIIFRANTPHRIQVDENTVYERHDILFDEKLLGNQIFNRIPKELDFINYSENRQVIDLFSKLDYCWTDFLLYR